MGKNLCQDEMDELKNARDAIIKIQRDYPQLNLKDVNVGEENPVNLPIPDEIREIYKRAQSRLRDAIEALEKCEKDTGS